MYLFVTTGGAFRFGVVGSIVFTTTSTVTDANYHVFELSRTGAIMFLKVDGRILHSGSHSNNISNTGGSLFIGSGISGATPFRKGSIETFSFSATAPTLEQSKFIAAEEAAIVGKPCLLPYSSSVTSLVYDASTDITGVDDATGRAYFKGLQRIDYAPFATGIMNSGGEAPFSSLLRTGSNNHLVAPAVDINAELTAMRKRTAVRRRVESTLIAAGGVVSVTKGFKPVSCYDVTGATLVRLTAANTTFDGFIHSVTGLTGTQSYDFTLEEI
ncbi:MAG: hypothetical protein R8K20_11930 [Gallionellaceae bacterium]